MERRMSRLEARAPWGSKDELKAASVVFMRVPEGGESDPRAIAARLQYERNGQSFCVTSLPAAKELPLWTPVPADRVSMELLDASILAILEKAKPVTDASMPPGEPSEIDKRIMHLVQSAYGEERT